MSKTALHGRVSEQHDVAAHDDSLDEDEHDSESGGAEGNDYAPHRDPERLEPVYEQFGTLYQTANYFGVSSPTIRKYLKRYGFYTPNEDTEYIIHPRELEDMSPEDVGLPPIGERR